MPGLAKSFPQSTGYHTVLFDKFCCLFNYVIEFRSCLISVSLIIFHCFCYFSCSNFSSLLSSTHHPPLPQATPHCCQHPWVMHLCSLATVFPMLYSMFPCLFCNYSCVFLPIPLTPSHLEIIKCFLYLSLCFTWLFCFLDSIVDRYVFFAILFSYFYSLLLCFYCLFTSLFFTIFYWLCHYVCPIFLPFVSSAQFPHSLQHSPPIPPLVPVHGSYILSSLASPFLYYS